MRDGWQPCIAARLGWPDGLVWVSGVLHGVDVAREHRQRLYQILRRALIVPGSVAVHTATSFACMKGSCAEQAKRRMQQDSDT